jgi:hypothetical protein
MVSRYDSDLLAKGAIKAVLGVVFSIMAFGLIFWCGWFFGFWLAASLGLESWQLGLLCSGLFLVVAIWSAWRRVNPLAGVPRMTDQQWLLTQLHLQIGGIGYFSPWHASAGFAVVLIGGPASVLDAIGLWNAQMRADGPMIDAMAGVLEECADTPPIRKVGSLQAALLLKRLALIKIVPLGDSEAFALTEKGERVLFGAKGHGRDRGTDMPIRERK